LKTEKPVEWLRNNYLTAKIAEGFAKCAELIKCKKIFENGKAG
jgi:hypothetical protein